MTEAEKMWRALGPVYQAKLIEIFYQSALYLKERLERDGWVWSWNYLREHARCAFKVRFSNTISPELYRVLREKHPDIAHFEDGQQGNLFALPQTPAAPPPSAA